jgi:gluconokinase
VILVITGVSGVGKTTVGKLLAQKLGWEFFDADTFHPAANIEKMKHAVPLTDADREPWLDKMREAIEGWLREGKNAVLACSALKKAYRDHLRVSPEVKVVFLRASRAQVAAQLQRRHGHFMPATLLDSQFADLEEPEPDEQALIIQIEGTPNDVVELIEAKLAG